MSDEFPVRSLPDIDQIPDRAPSDDHAVDWDRVRSAVRAARPVRAVTMLGLGVPLAMAWAEWVTRPVCIAVDAETAYGASVMASLLAMAGAVRRGRIRRRACAALLVAAVGGTLIVEPTRHLVTAWIVGAR